MKLDHIRYPGKPKSKRTQAKPSRNTYITTGFSAGLMRSVVHDPAFRSELVLCPSTFQMD
jgi:hypothetical protein